MIKLFSLLGMNEWPIVWEAIQSKGLLGCSWMSGLHAKMWLSPPDGLGCWWTSVAVHLWPSPLDNLGVHPVGHEQEAYWLMMWSSPLEDSDAQPVRAWMSSLLTEKWPSLPTTRAFIHKWLVDQDVIESIKWLGCPWTSGPLTETWPSLSYSLGIQRVGHEQGVCW